MHLHDLDQRRKSLLSELASLGDIRQGTLQERMHRCSNKRCICHEPGHRGHGPIYEFSGWENGKRRVWNLKPGPELDALRIQIEHYHRFKQITKELVEIGSMISQLRPLAPSDHQSSIEESKKKRRKRSTRKSNTS
jgi:hypothetical protein